MPTLEEALDRAAELLGSGGRALLVHHDDADGVISGFLLSKTLTHTGWTVDRVCLEKLYPQALNLIRERARGRVDLLAFADLASPHVPLIEEVMEDLKVLIVDHHDPRGGGGEWIVHINPELYGYSGEREASASTMAYLLAKHVGAEVEKYSFLAVVGSAEIPGPMRGLNLKPLSDGVRLGLVKESSGGRYVVNFHGVSIEHYRASSTLSTMASIGYYRGGPEVAIRACEEGFSQEVNRFREEVESVRREMFRRGMGAAFRSMRVLGYVQWFHVGRLFYRLGAKALGLLTSQVTFRGRVDRGKYVFGMMNLNPEIPGLGRLEGGWVKISGRTPVQLKVEVEAGRMPPVNEAMEEACSRLGGFADGHSYAASGVIPEGREEEFVELVNSHVSTRLEK